MNTIKLLAIFAENKTGELARVTGLLAEANLNIRWVTIASTEAFGVIKLLVDDSDMAFRQLKHNGVPVSIVDALAIEVEDKPGGLHKVARSLAANEVNIENASGMISNGRAVLFIETAQSEQAAEILQKQGFRLLSLRETLRT